MNSKSPQNIPASVRQRLLNKAREDQRPFNELLLYYAMERFLFRLSLSTHADKFILKGALMLRAWRSPQVRSTIDIDLLGRTGNDQADILIRIRDILTVTIEPDGLVFDPSSLQAEKITGDAEYEGIRVLFKGHLDSARISMQIDLGFGDVVFPAPEVLTLPTLLDSPSPKLLGYSRESAIAEKFAAMVKLRELNSRMKDFYDIWLLSRWFDFEGSSLAEAIRLTFENRGLDICEEVVAFSGEFVGAKQKLWTAFRNRIKKEQVPLDFVEVNSALILFLSPIVAALRATGPIPAHWTAAAGTWL